MQRRLYKNIPRGGKIFPSIQCVVCGGSANKISKFDIKIKTPELEDIKLLRSQLKRDAYTNAVYT